jgi:PAS domain S-box-containing protein
VELACHRHTVDLSEIDLRPVGMARLTGGSGERMGILPQSEKSRHRAAWIASLCAIAAIFVIERLQPSGAMLATAYVAVVVFAYTYLSVRQALVITILCTAATIADELLLTESEHFIEETIERALILGAIWLTAFLMRRRERLNTALEESKARYQAIQDSAADGILIVDAGGNICSVNPAASQMFGYGPDALAGQPLDALIPPHYREAHRHGMTEYAAGRLDTSRLFGVTRDVEVLRSDGTVFPVEINVSEVQTGGSRIFSAVLRDITERKEAELRIRESQRTLSTLMSNLPGMAYRCHNDESWTMLFVSQGCCALTGYEAHELEGNRTISFDKIIYPADREMVAIDVQKAIKDDSPFYLTYRIVHKSGEIRWVMEKGVAVRGQDGSVICLEGFISDVTREKRSEEALRESEQRFRSIADSTPIMIWASGLDMGITFANTRVIEFLGLPLDDLLGAGWVQVIHPDDHDRVLAEYGSAFEAWRPYDVEYRTRRRDGEWRWLAVHGVPRFAPGGEFMGFIGSARDITDQRRASEAVKESEARFRSMADGSPVMIWMSDPKGTTVFVNAGMLAFLGPIAQQDLGTCWRKVVHPDDVEAANKVFDDGIVEKRTVQTEYRMRRADGQWRTLLDTGAPRIGPDGEFLGFVGSAIDITERRKADQIIWHIATGVSATTGDEFFRSLANHLAEALGADLVGIGEILESDPSRIRTIAIVREGVIADDLEYVLAGTPCAVTLEEGDYACPEDVQSHFPDDALLVEDKIQGYIGNALRDSEGRNYGVLWVLFRRPVTDVDLAISLLRIFAVRAAAELERRQASEALRISEERYRHMFEESPMANIEVDLSEIKAELVALAPSQGTTIEELLSSDPDLLMRCLRKIKCASVNATAVRVFGASNSEQLRASISLLLTDRTVQAFADVLKRLWNGERTYETETDFRTLDGEVRDCRMRCVLTTSTSDDWSQVLIAVLDVTESRHSAEELARAKRLDTAGRLAGQIAHDFNNLLGPLVAYPEILQAKIPDEGRAHEMLRDMQDAALQIAEINQELLTLSRRGHYNVEPLDLNKLVGSAARALESRPTVTVETRLYDGQLMIRGGGAQLMRVLTNLMNNAVEAMDDIGTLTVTTSHIYLDQPLRRHTSVARGEYARVDITDSGCGIPADASQHIFEPFFTTKKTDRKRGTGLGLSVVHSVVEDHEGYVDVESVLGKGSTFSLYFPSYHGEVTVTETTRAIEQGTGEAVLVVDDDPLQRRIVLMALERVGYSVTALESGEAAVRFLADHPQDVVIIDMVMEGIDGAETLRRIREMYPDQKAMLLTGYATSERAQVALALGNCEVLAKPIQVSTLTGAIHRAIKTHSMRHRRMIESPANS